MQRFRLSILAFAALSVTLPSLASAQEWVGLYRGAPFGAGPTLTLDDANSTEEESVIRVRPHGFFLMPIEVNGVTYQRVLMPRCNEVVTAEQIALESGLPMGDSQLIGYPSLPQFAVALGLVRSDEPSLIEATPYDPANPDATPEQSVYRVGPSSRQPPIRPLPCREAGLDCDGGEPGEIVENPGAYDRAAPIFPMSHATVGGRMTWVTVDLCSTQVNIARWDPATRDLVLPIEIRIRVKHGGFQLPDDLLPHTDSEFSKAAKKLLLNYEKVVARYKAWTTSGEYLILVHDDFFDKVATLKDFLVADGATVTVKKVPTDVAQTSAKVQDAIKAHYEGTKKVGLPIVLLVGDVDRMPSKSYADPHPLIGTYATDKPYTLLAGGDQIPDVILTRLSADTVVHVHDMVQKIVRYQKTPMLGLWPEKVMLTCHQENAPGKYSANQCAVNKYLLGLAAAPAVSFLPGKKLVGGDCDGVSSSKNEDVTAGLLVGKGIVGYRGHGLSDRWDRWSSVPESWTNSEVKECVLNGMDARTPVVFAICCHNGDFDNGANDGIGEWWMQVGSKRGASAHYGSVPPSRTSVNDVLNRRVFENIYTLGVERLGLVTSFAEAFLAVNEGAAGGHTVMAYQLFGDGRMKVRTKKVTDGPVIGCPGDIDFNGVVDAYDLVLVLANWGQSPVCDKAMDMNLDGRIDGADLAGVLGKWGACPN